MWVWGCYLYLGCDVCEILFMIIILRKGFYMKFVEDFGDLCGKCVVICCDFNVLFDGDKIIDDGCIKVVLFILI